MRVLVIDCSRNGLAVIRSLGQEKVTVLAADHRKTKPGLHSKYVDKYFVVSDVSNVESFVEDILNIGRRQYAKNQEKTILLPVNDVYLLIFERHWDELEKFFVSGFENDISVLLSCVDKYESSKMAKKLGVPIPKTLYSPLTDRDIVTVDSYPMIVKPALGNSLENKEKNIFRLRRCNNREELLDAIDYLNNMKVKYVVQAYIPGGDDSLFTVGVSAVNGELGAVFTGKKLRQFPPRFGQCSYGETVSDVDIIVDYSRSLMKYSGFTGIAQIEFKRHGDDFYLMEINPRSWSWISLATYSGANLPYDLYLSLKGARRTHHFLQVKDGTWMYPAMDIRYNLGSGVSIFTFAKNLLSSSCYAHFQLLDAKPSVFQFFHTIANIFKKLKSIL